jgi:hypothetical protein
VLVSTLASRLPDTDGCSVDNEGNVCKLLVEIPSSDTMVKVDEVKTKFDSEKLEDAVSESEELEDKSSLSKLEVKLEDTECVRMFVSLSVLITESASIVLVTEDSA